MQKLSLMAPKHRPDMKSNCMRLDRMLFEPSQNMLSTWNALQCGPEYSFQHRRLVGVENIHHIAQLLNRC